MLSQFSLGPATTLSQITRKVWPENILVQQHSYLQVQNSVTKFEWVRSGLEKCPGRHSSPPGPVYLGLQIWLSAEGEVTHWETLGQAHTSRGKLNWKYFCLDSKQIPEITKVLIWNIIKRWLTWLLARILMLRIIKRQWTLRRSRDLIHL